MTVFCLFTAELLIPTMTEISYFCNVINKIAMRNLFLLIVLCCVAFSVRAQRLVEVGKGFSSTSVNTTVFRNNSIVTH